jgi:diaminohydroxyphosphoribosylaminopyrimidine deaminase/5-amino-6-(5-phosphoribosylamino)uracil reductase
MPITNQHHNFDIHYLKRALRLAKKGQGKVSPNPLVGAVLVKNNQIIGEGYHKKYGKDHAEINAINSASQSIKGATLFSTLEPCCHTNKQTPPCVERIIKEGVRRVVVASYDPNPQVDGKGLKILQDAGIEVTNGVLERENQEMNKFYFKYVKTGLPYVTIKLAQTIDGYISSDKNQQLWLSGERSKRLVHHWRSIYDSVLIGANTLRVDDPLLTVRYGKKRNPIRIVITGSSSIDPKFKIFNKQQSNKTWIITSREGHPKLLKQLGHTGCELIHLPANSDQRVPFISILEYLGKQKVTSVFVEGGQLIVSQLIQSKLWDELNIFIAPIILGKGFKSFNPDIMNQKTKFNLYRSRKIGEDVLLTYLPPKSNHV